MRRPYTPEELAKIAINEPSMSQFRAITEDPALPNGGGHYEFYIEAERSGPKGEPTLKFRLNCLGLLLKRDYILDNADRKNAYVEVQHVCSDVARYFLASLLTQPVDLQGM